MNGSVCVLEDGRRIRFSLKRRGRDPFYLVTFRGWNRRRLERSTKEPNQRRAIDAAIAIIRNEFAPKSVIYNPSWDEAIDAMSSFMGANNLRQPTIEDYKYSVRRLQQTFSKTHGPGEITPTMAERFKSERLKAGISPHTVRGDLTALKVVFGKWWCRVGKILAENPFAAIEKPKVERQPPRIIDDAERAAFLAWIEQRWSGWRIPILFLEVKNFVGCRISELASTRTACLKNGRLYFVAEATKGRKQRAVKLPPQIFSELQGIAGKTFVFESFSAQRRAIHIRRRNPHHAATIRDYAPKQLRNWLEDEAALYFRTHPGAKRFKLHNFRGTAMSRARQAGVSYDDASVAFGCHPETMRQHYISLDEVTITDRVMDTIQQCNGDANGHMENGRGEGREPNDSENGEI